MSATSDDAITFASIFNHSFKTSWRGQPILFTSFLYPLLCLPDAPISYFHFFFVWSISFRYSLWAGPLGTNSLILFTLEYLYFPCVPEGYFLLDIESTVDISFSMWKNVSCPSVSMISNEKFIVNPIALFLYVKFHFSLVSFGSLIMMFWAWISLGLSQFTKLLESADIFLWSNLGKFPTVIYFAGLYFLISSGNLVMQTLALLWLCHMVLFFFFS